MSERGPHQGQRGPRRGITQRNGRQGGPPRDLLPPAVVAADPAGWAGQLEGFRSACRVRQLSETTIDGRLRSLLTFAAWARDRGVVHAAQVTRPVLEAYQYHLSVRIGWGGRVLGAASQANAVHALAAFFRYAVRTGLTASNPAADLEAPKVINRIPEALSATEAERTLAQPDLSMLEGLRDRAMLEILYSSGLRRKELLGMRRDDVDGVAGVVRVLGKGRKERLAPLGARARGWLDRYLVEVRPHWVRDERERLLFLTATGRPVTMDMFSDRVKQYLTQAGITRRGGCHLFRHAMASGLMESGCDLRLIQVMLGHASPLTTARYAQISTRHLIAAHTAFHPAEVAARERLAAPTRPREIPPAMPPAMPTARESGPWPVESAASDQQETAEPDDVA